MARIPSWTTFRDRLIFFVGLGGIIFEVGYVRPPDPTALLLLATMCGLPAFLQRDEKRKDEEPEPDE